MGSAAESMQRIACTAAAAGGIALVNSIGNLGGYVGPFIVGWIKDSTRSFEAGLYFLAACALVACLSARRNLHSAAAGSTGS